MAALFRALPGITLDLAVSSALRAAAGSKWQLGFVSNTGTTCYVTSEEFRHQQEVFVLPDGTAGQWVVEFYRDPAVIESRAGQSRRWYRVRSVVVTAQGATSLPDAEVGRVEALAPLDLSLVHGFEDARRRVIAEMRTAFDFMSVASEMQPDGTFLWEFTFFRHSRTLPRVSREILAQFRVAGDGKRVLRWT
jgi:hypothetical protein